METQVFARKRIVVLLAVWLVVLSLVMPISWAKKSTRCPHHFRHQVKQCLGPYWSVVSLFSPQTSSNDINDVLTEHLCVQFETALVCLHTALRDCPGHANLKHVQSKLGSDWAMDIRGLCVGQSGLPTNRVPGEDEAEMTQVDDLFTSSGDLVRDYLAEDYDGDDEEASFNIINNNNNNNHHNDDKYFLRESLKIVGLARGQQKDVYRDIVVDVRKRVKLRFRQNGPKAGHIDVNVYNVFQGGAEMEKNSAGGGHRVQVPCYIMTTVVIILVRVVV